MNRDQSAKSSYLYGRIWMQTAWSRRLPADWFVILGEFLLIGQVGQTGIGCKDNDWTHLDWIHFHVEVDGTGYWKTMKSEYQTGGGFHFHISESEGIIIYLMDRCVMLIQNSLMFHPCGVGRKQIVFQKDTASWPGQAGYPTPSM